MKYTNVLVIILFNLFFTAILLSIENKSNFNKKIIIPIISSLLVKYIFGDWDIGYQWSVSDIYYWLMLLCSSYIFIYINN